MTWVWLNEPAVDFGGATPARVGDERSVWLHADPFSALDLPSTADTTAVRDAYRRLARKYHPDVTSGDGDSNERFYDLQRAISAINGEEEITLEPTVGTWWRFAGFEAPNRVIDPSVAVAGLSFEVRELQKVPLNDARDEVRISYAGHVLPLKIGYTGSKSALPVRLARLGVAAESIFLVALCLLVVPVFAGLLALDIFVISKWNVALFWIFAIASLAAGYGALAIVLATAGRQVPYPRRAVLRVRATVSDLRSLSRGQT